MRRSPMPRSTAGTLPALAAAAVLATATACSSGGSADAPEEPSGTSPPGVDTPAVGGAPQATAGGGEVEGRAAPDGGGGGD
ncbi:L,D-transpeptidase, partial [Nocardiopsis flavescens]